MVLTCSLSDYCGCGHRGRPARMLSLWSHLSYERSTKVFSAKSYSSPIRESFLPRKFPAIQYHCIITRKLVDNNWYRLIIHAVYTNSVIVGMIIASLKIYWGTWVTHKHYWNLRKRCFSMLQIVWQDPWQIMLFNATPINLAQPCACT